MATVALAVVPRLLSDTLSRALLMSGFDVVPAEALLAEQRTADIAVLSSSAASGVRARVVVRLPAGAGASAGTVTVDGQRREVALDSLHAVLEVIRKHC